MTGSAESARTAAEQLREAFDGAFAAQQVTTTVSQVDVLAIRVAGHGYALRLSEVQAVHSERNLTPVPSPVTSLLGLVGVRGLVVPIFDLRLLLGYDAGPTPRWLALARATSAVGFAFEAFEAHWRVRLDELVMGTTGEDHHRFARGSVRTEIGPRPLLHLPSLIESVTKPARPSGERAREERR